ncbi:helix-turn-helix domain-containing protein [Streptomyces vinaceus]
MRAPQFAERARIVLACASGAPHARVAVEIGVTAATVRKWRGKFAAEGMVGLEGGVRIGRPKAELVLSEAERDQLVRWARRAKAAQLLALRAKIVLRCEEGGTNKQARPRHRPTSPKSRECPRR